jgi:uncharacterized protein YecT (DUF1311 family)
MRSLRFILLLVLVVTPLSPAAAQEKKPSAQKAKAAFEKADKALNEAWAAAKAALPEMEFNTLKDAQKAWVEYRDYLARSPLYNGSAGGQPVPLEDPLYLETSAALEESRTRWLKGLVRPWAADETLTGEWSDSYGGHLLIVEKEGKLHFILECARGPTSHTGNLGGIATWNQRIGWFSDKGQDAAKEDETNLSFILRHRKLEVIGANTSYYHGARAYFDGEYVKTGPLSAKAQEALLKPE